MPEEVTRERVSISGPRGLLAGELAYPAGRPNYVCAIFSPHPHMGGSADNNLVAAIAEGVAEAGGVSLRFDYAGVGRSEGPPMDVSASMAAFWETGRAPEDPHMLADAAAASQWLSDMGRGLPLLLVGYSFGAYVAAQCCGDLRPAAIAAISPTLTQHDFSPLRDADSPPLIVIYSDDDFATPLTRTQAFLASLPRPAQSYCVTGGEHFFRGSEPVVTRIVTDFFQSVLNPIKQSIKSPEVIPC